jgi:hypothetical protein
VPAVPVVALPVPVALAAARVLADPVSAAAPVAPAAGSTVPVVAAAASAGPLVVPAVAAALVVAVPVVAAVRPLADAAAADPNNAVRPDVAGGSARARG